MAYRGWLDVIGPEPDNDFDEYIEVRDGDPVLARYWDPGWWPLAVDGGGNALVVDTVPTEGGTVGQIVVAGPDEDQRRRVGTGVLDYLRKLTATGPSEQSTAAHARGDIVVATARDADSITGPCAQALRLDVTDPASIEQAVAAAHEAHGRIDVLVNNAGHGLIGAVEELTPEDLQELLDVNLLGVLRVTRAVLPHLRRQRSGHIVQMSSVGGVIANPGHAAYATSKFALEGLSEALAGEVADWGIRVTIVEPGPFRTDFAGSSIARTAPLEDYRDTPAGRLRERFGDQDGRQPNDPAKAAAAILAAVDDPDAPLRLPLGPEAVERIRAKLESQLADLARTEAIGRDTRFGPTGATAD